MADEKKIKTTTPSGAPSICEWELTLSFKTKGQVEAFIAKIFAMEINAYPTFSFEEKSAGGVPRYVITMEYIWARNLVRFAEMLAEIDHEG